MQIKNVSERNIVLHGSDNVFVINKIFSLLMVKWKQMYSIFTNIAKAFDSV